MKLLFKKWSGPTQWDTLIKCWTPMTSFRAFFKAMQAQDLDLVNEYLAAGSVANSIMLLKLPPEQWARWVLGTVGFNASAKLSILVWDEVLGEARSYDSAECIEKLGFTLIGDQCIPSFYEAYYIVSWLKIKTLFPSSSLRELQSSGELKAEVLATPLKSLALQKREPPFGYGVIVLQPIAAAQGIAEYLGVVSGAHKTAMSGDTTYMMEYPFLSGFGWCWTINAKQYGNITRFINHSRKPNAKMKVFYDGQLLRLAVVALRNLKIGEEVTINYGGDYWAAREERVIASKIKIIHKK